VAIANQHWWATHFGQEWQETCPGLEQSVSCRFVNLYKNPHLDRPAQRQVASRADALLYNICPIGPRPQGVRARTPVVVVSAESIANYPCQNSRKVMSRAEIEVSHRSCAQVG
jgi:hypothetical protein